MARIDSILGIVQHQGADELRVGVNREPSMFARGAPKRLSIPATSEETLRVLLGELLTPEREQRLRERGTFETSYEAGSLGSYRVTFTTTPAGFDAVFLCTNATPAGPSQRAGSPPGTTSRPPAALSRPSAAPLSAAVAAVAVAQAVRSSPPSAAAPRAVAGIGSVPQPAAAGAVGVDPPSVAGAIGVDPPSSAALRSTDPDLRPTALRATDPDLRPAVLPNPEPPPLAAQPVAADDVPVAELLAHASELRASDLHLACGESPTVRVDGTLQRLALEPVADLVRMLGLDAASAARAEAGEGVDLALQVQGVGRVRVHVYRTASGLAAALRLLPRAAPTFAALNMPIAFDDLVDLPHGLVLVCGAAGSGKSTTLAALAQEALRRRSCVLVSLEDPIEYALAPGAHSLVRRRQIGRDVADFPSGLRDALRADPELLLLGELRDPETIALALTAAETGHLVLASLHSRSAASAIERIVDAFAPEQQQQVRLQLADALRAVIAQRLLPRAHGEGRVPAIELLRCTRAVGALIREGKTAQLASVLQAGRREGMLVLERSLADRVQAGEVSSSDAYAATNDPETLTIFLSR